MKSQILLVDSISENKCYEKSDTFAKKYTFSKMYDIPYGLLALASYLKIKHITVKIISLDYEVEKKDKSDEEILIEYLKNVNPKIVGFSAYTWQFNDCKRLAKIVRNYNKDIKIVIGGCHAMYKIEEVLQTKLFDIVVIGEGERTLTEYILHLSSSNLLRDIKGIAYLNSNGKIVITSKRERLEGNEIAPIDYSLLPFGLVKNANIWISTSRGCPYNCSFCSRVTQDGKIVRVRPLNYVKDEIEILIKKYKHKKIHITDETFHIRKDFDEFLKLLGYFYKEYGMIYTVQTRADAVLQKPDLLKIMKSSGINTMFIGAESASEKVLKEMNKGITYQQVLEALKLIKKNRIKSGTYWIIGHPGSSYEEELKTKKAIIQLLDKKLSNYVEVSIFTPFPGSRASKDSRINWIDPNFSKFNSISTPVFSLVNFPKKEIKKAYLEIIKLMENYENIIK